MTEDLKEALAYFTSQSVHLKLFKAFKEKFESYGRLSGAVKIDRYTEDELQELALFIGTTTDTLRKKKTLKITHFEQALKETKFGSITLLEILESYYKEPFVSKKNKALHQLDEENLRMSNWRLAYAELQDWFDVVQRRTMDVQWILRLMREVDFEQKLTLLQDAIRLLPNEYVRLPFFSQRVTGNPHTFDLHTVEGKLLLNVLRVKSGEMASTLSSTEEVNELLLKHFILRDDLSNDVSVANIIGYTNGTVHPMWQVACETRCAWNVPLREVLKVDEVRPAIGKRVYIVENSGVFSTILDAEEAVPLLCTHGQFKLAALKLMDMLVIDGCELYYAGDFDPEGLNMAQRILERYPGSCYLWRMDVDSYSASRPTEDITNRFNKLASIQSPLLMPIVDQMKQSGRAGYQEALLEKYVADLKG